MKFVSSKDGKMNKKLTFSTLRMLLCSALVLALVASCSNFMDFQEEIGNITRNRVSFDSAGATSAATPGSIMLISPKKKIQSLPASPEKAGYTFGGWYTEPNGEGTAFTENTEVKSSFTVYAKWTPNFSISVTTNKPDDVGTTITVDGSVSVAQGTAVNLSVSESFSSYEWLLDGSTNVGTAQSVTIGTADLSAGVHLVVLFVTDSGGYEYTGQVYIEVTN